MGIATSSLIVELNISVWTGQRVDKTATQKVAADNNASNDAGLFRKNLMAGTSLRKEIADYAALCRTWHNGRTLPWADKGGRLLPMSMFMDYKNEANARRNYFTAKVDEFRQQYVPLVQTAQQHLGAMFDPADYPSLDEVMTKFGFRLVFSPVPEAGDFRLDVGAQDLAELRDQYESAYDTRVGEAMQSAWTKLHDMLEGMSSKLDENEGEKKIFRDTWLPNVMDLCSLLTHLNITKDPELEKARRDLERMVTVVDMEGIRKDAGVRADLKAQVDAVLGRYEW
jgi:hypothetical protein